MTSSQMVYLIDDDAGIRKSLSWMLQTSGLPCTAYESATPFLEKAQPAGPSCLILDLQMSGLSGIDVLTQLKTLPQLSMPVLILTGTGTVSSVVDCMKLGADDFLEKPVDPLVLLQKIHRALDHSESQRAQAHHKAVLQDRIKQLTERERQVLTLLCQGHSTKQIASKLNISTKTVSIHRWHLLKKMQAGNSTEVIHLALRASAA